MSGTATVGPGQPLLRAHDITIVAESSNPVRLESLIIGNVSFDLVDGGALGIAGESGSGKTTLVQSLFGYIRPGMRVREGIVELSGRQLSLKEPQSFSWMRGRELALVPQSAGSILNPIMSIRQQLSEVCRVMGFADRSSIEERLDTVLRDVGLDRPDLILSRYPHELSGGQRQRIVLCLALIAEPSVLIMDEATSDLDVITQLRILRLIRDLQRRHGFGLVVVSHDLRVLAALCEDVLVLYRELVVESGPLRSLFDRPGHPYSAQLVKRFSEGPVAGGSVGAYELLEPDPAGCAYRVQCPMAAERCLEAPPLLPKEPTGLARCWFSKEVPARLGVEPTPKGQTRHAGGEASAGNAEVQQADDKTSPILLVENLRASHRGPGVFVRRRFEVLHEVGLAIREGETVGIVGESGSGKSTLARIVAGLHAPGSGLVRFGDFDLSIPAHRRPLSVRRGIQIIFQNPETALNPVRRIGDVLRRRVSLFEGTRGSDAQHRVVELLRSVGLAAEFARRRPSQLSGGQKQRVAIARALIGGPRLIICDEILSSLDVINQARIIGLLNSLREAHRLALMFISHDIGVSAAIADRIIVFKDGVIREQGRTTDVLWAPQDEYTAQLVSSSLISVDQEPEQAM